jgi:hypothetical protein
MRHAGFSGKPLRVSGKIDLNQGPFLGRRRIPDKEPHGADGFGHGENPGGCSVDIDRAQFQRNSEPQRFQP